MGLILFNKMDSSMNSDQKFY